MYVRQVARDSADKIKFKFQTVMICLFQFTSAPSAVSACCVQYTGLVVHNSQYSVAKKESLYKRLLGFSVVRV